MAVRRISVVVLVRHIFLTPRGVLADIYVRIDTSAMGPSELIMLPV